VAVPGWTPAGRSPILMRMKHPATSAAWSGRVDAADGPAARRWHQLVRVAAQVAAPVALVGFACDAGVSRNAGRPGAADGPAALRRALGGLAAHRVRSVDDLGDVVCVDDGLESAQAEFASVITAALASGSLPIGLGGGHEIALASYRGLRGALDAAADQGVVAIINFDAHFDLRADSRSSSGTPFREILEDAAASSRRVEYHCLGVSRFANTAALFDRARALGVHWVHDEELRVDRFDAIARDLDAALQRVEHAYLTICLDVFPASVAPGVSAPAALGVDPGLVERLIERVAGSGKLRVADIAELNPRFDIDGRTARLAARLVARIAETVYGG
jgi:formiminoglutamase